MAEKFRRWAGFDSHSQYVRNYIDLSNIKAAMCMSCFVVFVEVWMILRTFAIILFGIENRSQEWIRTHMCLYVVMLIVAITMFVFSVRYLRVKKCSHKTVMLWISIYSLISATFGIYVSYLDYIKKEQILSFITMVLFVECLIVWRPYVSCIILAASFSIFYALCASSVQATVATKINLFTTWVAAIMISVSNYNQRLNEAQKDQGLEDISTHDDLTGISNMRYFRRRAQFMLQNAFEHGRTLTFMFFDIENFKTYNERYGFMRGNELLCRMAVAIKDEFSVGETARFSDDHFVALVDEEEYEFEKHIDNLNSILKELEGDTYLRLRVGIYHTEGMKKDGSEPEDINLLCDRARFAAGSIKQMADVPYCIYDEKLHEQQRRKRYIISHLDSAVVDGHIQVYYQPIIDAKTGKVYSLEALARWNDPVYGLLSPGEFIEALEEFRLIHKLDKYVVDLVCGDIRDEIENGKHPLPVSVNLSRLDFELCDIAKIIIDTTKGLDKKYLVIEVTESALTKNQSHLGEAVAKLRSEGFSVWLDDFGSGYSSLNVLKDYSFDLLKIDMRFLEGFGKNENLRPILETIIELCRVLNMKALAEGVETQQEYDFLKSIGCDRVQGYLFSKPVTRVALKEMFDEGRLPV